ncbi:MAG: nucleotidyltransferase [Chloroflexi bacterium]|nr:nucleotidyltransferase [Chloroflexota bacterium]
MYFDQSLTHRNRALLGVLDALCLAFEPTESQVDEARDRYEGVADWLSTAAHPALRRSTIYVHGSVALRTANRPLGSVEFDVDLICFLTELAPGTTPETVKRLVGVRLRENLRYAGILEEKRRCWRVNYANKFHLDITPSIRNPTCSSGGELMADKVTQTWRPTNPRGYKDLFARRAALEPRVKLVKADERLSVRADVKPFPQHQGPKGVLRRIVQLLKRHRDIYFQSRNADLAPISIIITTLAAQSYEACSAGREYEGEFDLLLDVVRSMPRFIETHVAQGRTAWFVWNETTSGENFADKWSAKPELATAFFDWHGAALRDLHALREVSGVDALTKVLAAAFGQSPAARAVAGLTEDVAVARHANTLAFAPGVGLGLATAAAMPVRANTFFGA